MPKRVIERSVKVKLEKTYRIGAARWLVADGGKPPYSFKLAAGNLPAGLSLGTDGAIHGVMEDRAATALVQVFVTDSATPYPYTAQVFLGIEGAWSDGVPACSIFKHAEPPDITIEAKVGKPFHLDLSKLFRIRKEDQN